MSSQKILSWLQDIAEGMTGTAYVVQMYDGLLHFFAVGTPDITADLSGHIYIRGNIDTDAATLKKLFDAVDYIVDEYGPQLQHLRTVESIERVIRVMAAIRDADAQGVRRIDYTDGRDLQDIADALRDSGYRVEQHGRSMAVRW